MHYIDTNYTQAFPSRNFTEWVIRSSVGWHWVKTACILTFLWIKKSRVCAKNIQDSRCTGLWHFFKWHTVALFPYRHCVEGMGKVTLYYKMHPPGAHLLLEELEELLFLLKGKQPANKVRWGKGKYNFLVKQVSHIDVTLSRLYRIDES